MIGTFLNTDETRARGVSVEFKCDNCEASRKMDDLQRKHIGELNEKLSECDLRDDERVAVINKLLERRQLYRLAIFAVSLVAFFALASDAGWLK